MEINYGDCPGNNPNNEYYYDCGANDGCRLGTTSAYLNEDQNLLQLNDDNSNTISFIDGFGGQASQFGNPWGDALFAQNGVGEQSFSDANTFAHGVTYAGIGAPLVALGSIEAASLGIDYLAVRAGAYYATAAGTGGVILGNFDPSRMAGPVQVAGALGMNALNMNQTLFNSLESFGAGWTANQAFLDKAVETGQDIYLISEPFAQGYYYTNELLYLSGIGAQTLPAYK